MKAQRENQDRFDAKSGELMVDGKMRRGEITALIGLIISSITAASHVPSGRPRPATTVAMLTTTFVAMTS